MTPEEVLAKAAELVERAWRQDSDDSDPEGRGLCAFNALRHAAPSHPLGGHCFTHYEDAMMALVQELGDDLPKSLIGLESGWAGRIGQWNDAPGRTKEEVATRLRNAKRFC